MLGLHLAGNRQKRRKQGGGALFSLAVSSFFGSSHRFHAWAVSHRGAMILLLYRAHYILGHGSEGERLGG